MGRKRKYATSAERSRAWRIRSGRQKQKVPVSMRIGERLGSSELEFREKKEDETWEEYHAFIRESVEQARKREGKAGKGVVEPGAVGSRRVVEPTFTEDYYELRVKYEKDLEVLEKNGRKYNEK